jgi:hypothetical protein
MTLKFTMFPLLILFLFGVIAVIVLCIKLCSKRPWIAAIAALVLLLVLMPILVLNTWRIDSHSPAVSIESISTDHEDTTAAIWLPGIEDEFEANVYPSKLSTVRSLGLRIGEPIQHIFGAQTLPARIILFHGAHDHGLIDELRRAIAQALPETDLAIEPETVAVQTDEVGIRLDLLKVQELPASWQKEPKSSMISGTYQASVLAADKQASIQTDFVEKPWVEDLADFLTTRRMDGRFIIAKSADSCITESEANRQALENASTKIAHWLDESSRRLSGIPAPFARPVNSTDILEGDFILDRFVQSFKGTAGRIWRQAFLIDASAEKLTKLAHRKAVRTRARKMSWARMFFSIVGLLVLITVVYAFLNAATKGYYVWSLRIAGIILALITIIILLV